MRPMANVPAFTGVPATVYSVGPAKAGKRFSARIPMAIPSHDVTAVYTKPSIQPVMKLAPVPKASYV